MEKVNGYANGFSTAIATSVVCIMCGQALTLIVGVVMHIDSNLGILGGLFQALFMTIGLTSYPKLQKTMKYWGEIYLLSYTVGLGFAAMQKWVDPVEVILTVVIGVILFVNRHKTYFGLAN
jgi:hypothetical protein